VLPRRFRLSDGPQARERELRGVIVSASLAAGMAARIAEYSLPTG
jgi:hypothetical protein